VDEKLQGFSWAFRIALRKGARLSVEERPGLVSRRMSGSRIFRPFRSNWGFSRSARWRWTFRSMIPILRAISRTLTNGQVSSSPALRWQMWIRIIISVGVTPIR
jgi:hypothetical protein